MITEVIAVISPPLLIAIGVFIGRLSITQQQRIVRLRQERHRWLLQGWQNELERREGGCVRCRGR